MLNSLDDFSSYDSLSDQPSFNQELFNQGLSNQGLFNQPSFKQPFSSSLSSFYQSPSNHSPSFMTPTMFLEPLSSTPSHFDPLSFTDLQLPVPPSNSWLPGTTPPSSSPPTPAYQLDLNNETFHELFKQVLLEEIQPSAGDWFFIVASNIVFITGLLGGCG